MTRARLLLQLSISLCVSLSSAGCLVQPVEYDESLIPLSFSLAVPGEVSQVPKADAVSPWDTNGLFHLDMFSKLVRVALIAEDYELQNTTWPDPRGGMGVDGEGEEGEVFLEMQVPAGAQRQFAAVAFVVDPGMVIVYQEESPVVVDLAVGGTHDLTINMTPVEKGSAEVTIRCQSDISTMKPQAVALVDAKAQALFPTAALVENGGVYQTTIKSLPLNRAFWVRVTRFNTQTQESDYIDVRAPLLKIGAPNEAAPFDVTIPCT